MNKRGFIESIGNTPLIYLSKMSALTGCEIYGKAEFTNPGGSVKDRAALGMIVDAEKRGVLKKGDLIWEGTAGNTGIGLALIGNVRGYRTKFVVPDTQAKEKVDTIRGMGSDVLVVPFFPYPDPNNYQLIAKKMAQEEGGYYINQFDNLANYRAHFETTGPEIWDQTSGEITTFVCAIGSGGTFSGVANFLHERNPKVRSGIVDPFGSSMFNWFSRGVAEVSPGDSITEGIGQGRVTENVKVGRADFSFQLEDRTVIEMLQYIVRAEGLFLGSSSAANLCGAYLAAKKYGPGQKIVTMLCDSGQKYVSKIYNPDWLKSKNLTPQGPETGLWPVLDRLAKS